MNKAYFMSFVLAAALPAMAAEEQYDPLFTGVSGGQLVSNDGGLWTTNGAAISTTNVTAVSFETADNTPIYLSVTAEPADTNTIAKVKLEVTLADVGTLMTSSELAGKLTAFAVCTNSFNAWNGSGWVALDEVPAGIDDSQTTNLTVEISYQGTSESAKRIRAARFTVGDTTLVTRDGSSEWIDLLGTDVGSKANLGGFGINGEGIIAKADASVMLGVAEYAGVKYGTISNAVEVAKSVTGPENPTVDVIRETDENIVSYLTGDDNAVHINAAADVPVTVSTETTPQPTDGVVAGNSGAYTASVDTNVFAKVNAENIQITLPYDGKKEVKPGSVRISGTTATFEVRTASSIVREVSPAGKALSADVEKLQEFLAKTASAKSDVKAAYEKADPTAGELATELAKNGDNDIPMYQSYALGIDQDTPVKPVTVANDTSESAITVEIPSLANVNANKSGDYNTIKYVVKKGDQVISDNTPAGGPISLPLNQGTGSYTVIIDMQ